MYLRILHTPRLFSRFARRGDRFYGKELHVKLSTTSKSERVHMINLEILRVQSQFFIYLFIYLTTNNNKSDIYISVTQSFMESKILIYELPHSCMSPIEIKSKIKRQK